MTLKTTKELTADSLWAKAVGVYYGSSQIGAPIFTGITKERFDEVVRPEIAALCHDADRARELEKENIGLRHIAGNRGWVLDKLEKEIADLRAKLDEAYGLLHMMFTAYENGADCYEDPEEQSGYLGKAIKLDEAAEHRIAGILNERRPALKERGK